MNRSDAAKLRAARALSKDPEYFAKLAARGKGKAAPNRARPINTETASKGGQNRNQSEKYQERKRRSEELQEKLRLEQIEQSRTEATRKKRLQEVKRKRDIKKQLIETKGWDDDETTVDDWQ